MDKLFICFLIISVIEERLVYTGASFKNIPTRNLFIQKSIIIILDSREYGVCVRFLHLNYLDMSCHVN